MTASFRVLAIAALLAVGRACADPSLLPPVEGQLSGELVSKFLPGVPLKWTIVAQLSDGDARHLVVEARADGLHLQGEADVNLATGEGRWTLKQGVLDVRRWQTVILSRFGGIDGLELGGEVKLTGAGLLHAGKPSGTLELVWSNGSVGKAEEGWTLDGIDVSARMAFDGPEGPWRAEGPVSLSVHTITTRRFGARNLKVTGELKDLNTYFATSAAIEIAGGFVNAAPFTMTLRPLALDVDLQLSRVGLQDVAALAPAAVADASGRVDGTVRLGWRAGSGFELGDGHLTLRPDEPARVRLHPSPGLITAGIPWYVRRFFYPGLDQAELGQVPLRADAMDVTFSPKPDAEGRTAVITLSGVPDAPNAKAPVNFQVNVHGPLQAFVKLGTTSGVSLSVR